MAASSWQTNASPHKHINIGTVEKKKKKKVRLSEENVWGRVMNCSVNGSSSLEREEIILDDLHNFFFFSCDKISKIQLFEFLRYSSSPKF